jgi:hypothetical protein
MSTMLGGILGRTWGLCFEEVLHLSGMLVSPPVLLVMAGGDGVDIALR